MTNQIELRTATDEQTREAARILAAGFSGGELLELCGPLGAGKTCFTKGLAIGLGVSTSEPIVSPTFVLMRRYEARIPLIHVDVYRLGSEAELAELGLDEYRQQAPAVIAIEWADRFPDAFGHGVFRVEIAYSKVEGEREIAISTPSGFDGDELIRLLRTAGISAARAS